MGGGAGLQRSCMPFCKDALGPTKCQAWPRGPWRNLRPRTKQPRTALRSQVLGQPCEAPRCWVVEGNSESLWRPRGVW